MFFRRKLSEADFWTWFKSNQERFFSLEADSQELVSCVNEIGAKLQKVNSDLQFELMLSPDATGKKTIFLSAGGIISVIPAVEKICAAAPLLERWNVVKFKQRKSSVGELSIAGKTFNQDTVFFSLLEDEPGKVGIHIYFDDFEQEAFNLFGQVGFIFLDGLLGEYDVCTKVGIVDFKSRSEVAADVLKPIRLLPEAFDNMLQQ